jgi:hypothetical protein
MDLQIINTCIAPYLSVKSLVVWCSSCKTLQESFVKDKNYYGKLILEKKFGRQVRVMREANVTRQVVSCCGAKNYQSLFTFARYLENEPATWNYVVNVAMWKSMQQISLVQRVILSTELSIMPEELRSAQLQVLKALPNLTKQVASKYSDICYKLALDWQKNGFEEKCDFTEFYYPLMSYMSGVYRSHPELFDMRNSFMNKIRTIREIRSHLACGPRGGWFYVVNNKKCYIHTFTTQKMLQVQL